MGGITLQQRAGTPQDDYATGLQLAHPSLIVFALGRQQEKLCDRTSSFDSVIKHAWLDSILQMRCSAVMLPAMGTMPTKWRSDLSKTELNSAVMSKACQKQHQGALSSKQTGAPACQASRRRLP